MRNMSCQLTKEQVLAGAKDVTRRLGWAGLRRRDLVQLCEKCQGLKKGEAPVKLRVIRVKSVRREPLSRMLDYPDYGRRECKREGFPHLSPEQFVAFFVATHSGATRGTIVTRIEWVYES